MTAWALETLAATTLLFLAVLVLRKPIALLFGARAAYALWLAPALRFLLPPIHESPAVVSSAVAGGRADYAIVIERVAYGSPLSIGSFFLLAWLIGAVSFLAFHWWRHDRFLSDALAHGAALPRTDVSYDVVATSRVNGPLTTGLLHPVIFVPEDFVRRFSPDQQRLALLHEQLHHRRGDLWASALALLLAAFHWFNPVAHVALAAFRRDMEAACDADVIAQTGNGTKATYAETILRCAATPGPRSLCALTSIDELKGRFAMLKLNHSRLRRAAGLTAALGVALSGAFTASAAQEAAPETKKFVKKIEVHGDSKDVLRSRDPGEHGRLLNCPGEKFEASYGSDASNKRQDVKFFLCAAKGESLLPALEKAAAEIEASNDMPAASKAEMLQKIRAKIAELRTRG